MATFLEQMQQHRADAVAERERLDARIAALDVLIAQESPATDVKQAAAPSVADTGRPRSIFLGMTMADAVLTVLNNADGGPIAFRDLVNGVESLLGPIKEKSLRGTLPRMEPDQIVRLGRGVYALPKNAEAPADTEASVGNPTPVKEGGGSRETTEAPASAAEDQRHPQLGASIGGSRWVS